MRPTTYRIALVMLAVLSVAALACGYSDDDHHSETVDNGFPVVIAGVQSEENAIGTTELVVNMLNRSEDVSVDAVRLRIKAWNDFGEQVVGLDDESGKFVDSNDDMPPGERSILRVTMNFYDDATEFEVTIEEIIQSDGDKDSCYRGCTFTHTTEE